VRVISPSPFVRLGVLSRPEYDTALRERRDAASVVADPMDFRILGPLEVLSDGQTLDLGGQKQRALLALLLLDANQIVPSERAIGALWDEPTRTAQKALQVYVSHLRKVVGRDRLQTKPPGYLIRVEPDELDLARFEQLRTEGRLHEALSLWRGAPLPEFANERFAQAEVARLEELRLACLEERIDADLAAGRHVELVAELEGLVRDNPLRERLRGQLMLALYRSGRQAEALEVYEQGRRRLTEELGLDPGRALQELHGAILRRDEALDAPSSADVQHARGAHQETAAAPVGTVTLLFTDIDDLPDPERQRKARPGDHSSACPPFLAPFCAPGRSRWRRRQLA
jgi:DNA-binding SARP family transcriptional activator